MSTIKHKTILCDTNVIIRYLLGESGSLGEKAKEFFDAIEVGTLKTLLLESVLTECVFILDKIYKIPRVLLVGSLVGLMQYKGVINEDKQALVSALELFSNTNLHIVDCILAIKSNFYGMELITFDKELAKIQRGLSN